MACDRTFHVAFSLQASIHLLAIYHLHVLIKFNDRHLWMWRILIWVCSTWYNLIHSIVAPWSPSRPWSRRRYASRPMSCAAKSWWNDLKWLEMTWNTNIQCKSIYINANQRIILFQAPVFIYHWNKTKAESHAWSGPVHQCTTLEQVSLSC